MPEAWSARVTPGQPIPPPTPAEIQARMLEAIARSIGGPGSRAPAAPVQLAELLALDGEPFVAAAYRAVLGRDADPDGLGQHLRLLQGGLDKAEMVRALRASPEGEQVGAPLVEPPAPATALVTAAEELPRDNGRQRLYRVPVLGRALLALRSLLRMRRLAGDVQGLHDAVVALQRDADASRQQLEALQGVARSDDGTVAQKVDGLSHRIASAEGGMNARLDALAAELGRQPWAEALGPLANGQEELRRRMQGLDAGGLAPTADAAVAALAGAFEQVRRDLGWTETGAALVARAAELLAVQDDRIRRAEALAEASRREMEDQRRRIGLLLNDVRRRLDHPFTREELDKLAGEHDGALDRLYLQFEDRFRGSRELIKQRQRVHLPVMTEAGAGTPDRPILDVGAGRGEWLELLQEAGLAARGIDLNTSMVETCRARGLDCTQDDAVAALAQLPAGSLGAVTGFHIIEHLPFPVLVALLDESLRALAPGGAILFETPNPANLMVGSRWFYLDPTHRNPLPGETVAMVAEARGFVDVQVRPLHPSEGRFSGQDKVLLRQLDEMFHGPQDYALVARKP